VDHVLPVQLGDAFQNGDQEGAELRVVGPAVRGDVLPYVPTWEEVAQQVWMILAVVGGGQHASTKDPHHARRADALHGFHLAVEALGLVVARDDLARLDFAVLDDPPALAHAAGRADARRLVAGPQGRFDVRRRDCHRYQFRLDLFSDDPERFPSDSGRLRGSRSGPGGGALLLSPAWSGRAASRADCCYRVVGALGDPGATEPIAVP